MEKVSQLFPAVSPNRVFMELRGASAQQLAHLEAIAADIARLRQMVTVANAAVPEVASHLAADLEAFSGRLGGLTRLLDESVRLLQ